jgi:DNA-binding response OmpR family regulator
MSEMCPKCGYNFKPDGLITRGDWELSLDEVRYKGEKIDLTPSHRGILYALAKANGIGLSIDALLNRVSDSDNPNVIYVHMTRIRQRLPVIPFEASHPDGYRWIGNVPS